MPRQRLFGMELDISPRQGNVREPPPILPEPGTRVPPGPRLPSIPPPSRARPVTKRVSSGARTDGTDASVEPEPPTDYDPVYGGVPAVPDPVQSALESLQASLQLLPLALQYAGDINKYLEEWMLRQYELGVPGYRDLISRQAQIIGSQLRGELPADVINLLRQEAAERGIATGLPGAGVTNAAYLRALGLTSLAQQQAGLQNLARALGTVPQVQPLDVTQFFVPRSDIQAAQWLANVLAAAPRPGAAREEELAELEDFLRLLVQEYGLV